jgi:hypothetical protein
MQPLSAPIPDLLFLPNLIYLKFDQYSKRLSDNVILRREPKNLEILRAAQDDNYGVCSVVGLLLPFISVRKKCNTSGMKFA